MTTLIFPNIAHMRQVWGLDSDTSISPSNPYTGTTGQRFTTPSSRWRCSLSFPPLTDTLRGGRQARSQLKAFLSSLRGQQNDFWLFDRGTDGYGNAPRGTFPRANVLLNGYFDTSINSWLTDGSGGTYRWSHGWLMLRSTGAGTPRFWQQCVVRDGAHYNVRVHVLRHRRVDAGAVILRVGTTAHASDLLADVPSLDGEVGDSFDLSGSFLAAGTTAFVEVEQLTTTPTVLFYTAVELQRVPQIHGSPNSTSNVLTVNEWDAPGTLSQDNLILVGDMLEVGGELKRSVTTVFSDGSARAFIQVEPPMRVLPADDTDVLLYRPRGRFILTTPQAEWEDALARHSSFALTCREVIL